MAFKEQISDAEYFLEALKRSYTREELRPNLGAFLTMSRSIADHLLEDYNMKFNLGIDLEEKLTYDRFEKGARDRSNQTALDFLKFYKDEFKNLKKDPAFKLLYDKRNIRIHRAGTPVRGEFYRGLSETVTVHDNVSILVIRKNGNNEQQSTNQQQPRHNDKNPTMQESETLHKGQDHTESGVRWYFTDYDRTDLTTLCQSFLDSMKKFVHKVLISFP
jgi:hypothetical protein